LVDNLYVKKISRHYLTHAHSASNRRKQRTKRIKTVTP